MKVQSLLRPSPAVRVPLLVLSSDLQASAEVSPKNSELASSDALQFAIAVGASEVFYLPPIVYEGYI